MKNKLILAFILFISLVSCSEPELEKTPNNSLKIENGRLVFASTDDLHKTLTILNAKSQEEIKEWIKENKLKSLLNKNDLIEVTEETTSYDLTRAPLSIQAILNESGEVKVGEMIIWYNDGRKHFIPNNDESLLAKIKQNPNIDKNHGWYSINTYQGNKEIPESRSYISSLDARHQKEFTYINGTPRKFVHEINIYTEVEYYFADGTGYQSYSLAYLNIKLEYKTSRGKWRVAGEPRNININLIMETPQYYSSGSLVFPFIAQTSVLNLNVSSSQDIYGLVLAEGFGPTYYGYSPAWNIDVRGTIYQYIIGDLASNAWYNTGDPYNPPFNPPL